MKKSYKLKGKVFLWSGDKASWHFVGVDKKTSEELREKHGKHSKGFGSLPVNVTIGKTTWDTSIFPDKKSGTYILPLKADVRRKESILNGETISFSLVIR